MKIVSYNINGIRASAKRGLLEWIAKGEFDVLCFQEVRASEQVAREIMSGENSQTSFLNCRDSKNLLSNYYATFNCGTVAGYAGTVTLSKFKPDKIIFNMDEFWSDAEGRTTTIIYNNYAIVNAYIPNGNSRLDFKMQYLEALTKFINKLKESYSVICVGDFNIAHKEIDLTNPKECQNKSVFLPIERIAFDKIVNSGFIDVFRFLNNNLVKYSWRSYRAMVDFSYNAWKYRIDYVLVSENLKSKLVSSDILDLLYSDHLPVIAEIS